jgi:DNA-directed RNA polymerase specialized sigma24 family protein
MNNVYTVEQGVKENFSLLGKMCRRYRLMPDKVKELRSEVLETIWIHEKKFNGIKEDFPKWLSVITRNKFLGNADKETRSKKHNTHYQLDFTDASNYYQYSYVDPVEDLTYKALVAGIEKNILRDLGNEYWIVFEAVFLQGYTPKEFTKLYGHNVNYVNLLVKNIRKYFVKTKLVDRYLN